MIAALTASPANAVLGTPALNFLQALASPGSKLDPVTRDLLNKPVNRDPANAYYHGFAAGGTVLTSSTTSGRVGELESKWFLGTDHPTADVAYQATTLPPFGAGGPLYSDIVQGQPRRLLFPRLPGGDGRPPPEVIATCSPRTATGRTASGSSTTGWPST